ncbi:MAG: MBOAT family protein [Oscillospiraceae bacterium]|nr:MBOAT family protein [Oscillospiraceae bacterium]
MVFSSLTFLFAFMPITFILYYLVPLKAKNVIIMISGIVFYAWGEPLYVFAMLLSTAIDYCAGLLMHKYDDNPKIRTACLIVSLLMNLGLLGTFKYLGFIINSVNAWFGWEIANPNLPLPIGISFFTFQSMSYTIDLYRRNIKVQKNPVSFIGFVSLFPQLVAGPIVRYEDIQNEIDNRTITEKMVGDGICRFITGLGKKVLIANNIGMLWTTIKETAGFDYTQLSTVTAWLGILAFTFQIFFDFSGYSDMAIGLGKMMGFNFPENFDYPYMSHSVSEFWRRWHMTLGAWFKSYIYIPLGGNRKGLARTIINLLIVWTVTGIWHGASWNFMLWGLYFGILIVLERLFLGKVLEKIPPFFSWLYTFVLVVFGWVMFDAIDPTTVDIGVMFSQVFTYIGALFGANGVFIDNTAFSAIMNYGIIFALCILGSSDLIKTFSNFIRNKAPQWMQYGIPVVQLVVMLMSIAYLSTASYNPFLYFNF